MNINDRVEKYININEVVPRDGLQNESIILPTKDKIALINQLSYTGVKYIEITSFVNPRWIPSLADALEVAKGIERVPGVKYAALVPNLKGLERALKAEVDEVSIFLSASETHNKKNINKSINQTYPILREVAKEALAAGKTVRAYLSTVFGCPYEGSISVDQVVAISEILFDMGIRELSLGDTVGVAHPSQIEEVLEVLLNRFSAKGFAMHFHNTRGMAMANVLKSLDMGIVSFDSSLGGLGGCPYAPGASGNLATDDLLYMLHGMNIQTGIDDNRLVKVACYIQEKMNRKLPSHSLRSGC